jgi:hypothetical protein
VTYVIRIPTHRFNESDLSRSALFLITKKGEADGHDEPVCPQRRKARKKLKVKPGEK